MKRSRRLLRALLLTALVWAALASSAEEAPPAEPAKEAEIVPADPGDEEPGESKDILTVSVTGSEQTESGGWQLAYQSTADTMEVCWNGTDGAALYRLRIVRDGKALCEKEIAGTSYAIPLSDLLAEDAGEKTNVTLTVTSLAEDGSTLADGSLSLTLVRESGKRPGGKGGGRRKTGGTSQGFSVTPGTSLIRSHINGSKDARLYGSVEIVPSAEPTNRLSLGSAEIASDGDFTVALEDGALTLSPVSDCEAWTFPAKALKTLLRSGVHTLTLFADGRRIEFSTDLQMKGDIYAELSARGIVSKDYAFTVTADGTRVAVAGEQYLFTADNELAKIGG